MKFFTLVISLALTFPFFSQSNSDINLNILWDNDLYFLKDRYYTNGLEIVLQIDKSKQYKKNYFVKDKSLDPEHHITSIGLAHKMYTPRAYRTHNILKHDRPYAGALYATIGGRKTHSPKESIYTEVQVGFLGPYTGAKPIQTEWHQLTNSDIPGGWDNQIQTTLILNYNFQYDRSLLKLKELALISTGRVEVGTYNINIQGGFNLLLGHFNHPFYGVQVSNKNKKSWTTNIDIGMRLKAVGYNASLQGNTFHSKDPHSFKPSEIKTFVWMNSAEINFMRHWLLLGFSAHLNTPEFVNAKHHLYGSLKAVFLI